MTSSLLKQYNSIKEKYPDALLLFRVGDFYECFNKDAKMVSEILGLVLTKLRTSQEPTLLTGFRYTFLDEYLPKLVRAGCRVAICDQLQEHDTLVKKTPDQVKRSFSPGEQPCLPF